MKVPYVTSFINVENHQEKLETVRELFREYVVGLNENLCFQSFDEELRDPFKKYGEPKGCLVLAYLDGKPAGCVALQPLEQKGVCEMKRLYVRTEYRYLGLGGELVKIILKAAADKGYHKMVLDTLERLQPAIRLYLSHGFVHTSAYYNNPLKGVVYMEKEL